MSSQYNEDAIIQEFFGDFVGTFLDLGAGDGRLCSNTFALVERGWMGSCIEPHAESFIALRKLHGANPRVKLVNCAISARCRPMRFFPHDGQLSTGIQELAQSEKEYLVAAVTLEMLFPAPAPIDFVSLDCEGMDQEILVSGDRVFRYVRLLCYEHNLPEKAPDPAYTRTWERLLARAGFTRVIGKTEGNTLVARP